MRTWKLLTALARHRNVAHHELDYFIFLWCRGYCNPKFVCFKMKKILHMFRKNYLSCLKQLSHQSQKVAF